MIPYCPIFWSFRNAKKMVAKILAEYKLLELRSFPLEPLAPRTLMGLPTLLEMTHNLFCALIIMLGDRPKALRRGLGTIPMPLKMVDEGKGLIILIFQSKIVLISAAREWRSRRQMCSP